MRDRKTFGTKGFISTALILAIAMVSGQASAENGDLPFGMRANHLNLVFSVTDPEKVHEFYGEILGLEPMPNIDFPGDPYMIRYLGGESEIKFIVTHQDLPKMEGGTRTARGIRLLALLLPEEKSAGILERLEAAGLDSPEFTEGEGTQVVGDETVNYGYRYGMVYDYDGNQIELVFLDDRAPEEKFKQAQIGLSVSNMAAMDKFLTDILGLEPVVTEGRIHRYGLGVSQVKFWEVPDDLPTWVGSPFEKVGFNLVQFIVPDVDAVRKTIVERGGTIHTEPFPLGQLATIMFVEGPDGILFEFAGPLLPRFRGQ